MTITALAAEVVRLQLGANRNGLQSHDFSYTIRNHGSCFVMIVGLLLAAGCGSRDSRVQVTGTVTINGKPLTDGHVTFFPVDESPGMVRGTSALGPYGNYRLSTYKQGDGILPGSYRVAILSYKLMADGVTPTKERAIPKRYFFVEDSGLTAEVSDKPSQTFNFEITSQ